MSYHVHLFPPGCEDDLAAAYERLEDDVGPPDPTKEERKQRLAERLQSLHPALAVTERDYAAIASVEGISEQKARWENREVELIGPSFAGQTVQVDLFDDEARVGLESPNHVGDVQALRFAWDCLHRLVADRGFVPYDPQLGREIDLEHDFEAVLVGLRSFVDEQDGLARAAATELADVWEWYWPTRELSLEEVAEQDPRLGERGLTVIRLALTVMNASDLNDPTMAQALGLLVQLADDCLLMDWASLSESEFELLPWQLSNRTSMEHFAFKTGIADWCSRFGRPLLDRYGDPLGFGIGPLPGRLPFRDARMLILTYGAPGAERAAPDAQNDLDSAVSEALPVSQEVLTRLEHQTGLSKELRDAADLHGRTLMRVLRMAVAPLMRNATLRGKAKELNDLDTRVAFISLVANCLVLVTASETEADLNGILMYDNEVLASLA